VLLPTTSEDVNEAGRRLRLLAFYLPQFHPIPENDRWWGKGFTDWVNVAKARPLFPGHYQPHVPGELGYYDLRDPAIREAQAALAKAHGVSAFCYYHYWFGGTRLLQEPIEQVLRLQKPDLPFCLCWANENWTRRWDGLEREVLISQAYSLADDRAHLESLLPAFRDPRYVRINGKPLFLVYRTEQLPDPARTAETWREQARAAGLPGLFLARVESFVSGIDPLTIGFDGAVEFAPDWRVLSALRPLPLARTFGDRLHDLAYRLHLPARHSVRHQVYRYDDLVERMLAKPSVSYRRFPCVTPSWDNAARRRRGALIFSGSTPDRYEQWLRSVLERSLREQPGDERLVFINAWNEWAEGNHLEPDQRWGPAYLEATRRAATLACVTATRTA
jgi:lipopolysaccharide biosynthesis protein